MAKYVIGSVVCLLLCCLAAEAVNIGEVCTAAAGDCPDNAGCTGTTGTTSTKCECQADFVAKSDNTACLMKVNGICTDEADCLENADCSGTTCVCKLNFSSNDDGTQCSGASTMTSTLILTVMALLASRFF